MPYPRLYLVFGVVIALVAYLWGVHLMQIPKIGDEVLYLQIARVTGESGQWLPLRYEEGILSTKPPLLYWLGIASARVFGPSLFAYRLPVLLATFLSALLVWWLGRQYLKDKIAAFWAACAYLGFISTYQHGRPYLVNSFEVLFLLLPLSYLFARPVLNPRLWIVCALAWGAVAWTKSFALIVVGAFALFCAGHFLSPASFMRRAIFFGSAALLSLGIFALWFVFDPDPRLLFEQFIIGENAVKFKGYAHYLSGLFTGNYPLFRIWLGPLANAGLYVLVIAGVTWLLIKRRAALRAEDKALAAFILAFLVFYSLPTQRQENYLLPAMAVFAILLARFREEIARILWKISLILVDVTFIFLTLAVLMVGLWGDLSPLAKSLWVLASLVYPLVYFIWGRRQAFPLLVLLCLIQLTNFSDPFNRQFTYFREHAGTAVLVPSRKLAQHERFRFIAPGSIPAGYTPGQFFGETCTARQAGDLLIVEEEDLPKCTTRYERIEQIRDFKTRQKIPELLQIVAGRKEYLIKNLYLIKIME